MSLKRPATLNRVRLIGACGGLAFAGIAVWALWRHDPAQVIWFPPCTFYEVTGWHCPGCGGTRAAHALLQGHWWAAVCWNPLLVVGLPLIGVFLWRRHALERAGHRPSALPLYFLFCVFVAYFLFRNLPTPESAWLAPGLPSSFWPWN